MADLNEKEAYLAMFSFLEHWYEMTKSDDVGSLLGSMPFLQDGSTADPALWSDWEAAIQMVRKSQVDAMLRLKK